MYSNIISVQIIISLLKQYNIKYLVLSPGTRNGPFVHSVENDPFFECFSIVDERSAAYFALGLSKNTNQPVVLSCTSSTATCNYLPAIKEAREEGVQLIALTADRDRRFLGQLEDQMIDQIDMYKPYTRKSIHVPYINNSMDLENDIWYSQRIINEALLELDRNGNRGPVQINYEMYGDLKQFNSIDCITTKKISRLYKDSNEVEWNNRKNQITRFSRIMIIVGQDNQSDLADIQDYLETFLKTYNSIVAVEMTSNMLSKDFFHVIRAVESMSFDEIQKYLPELVITIGNAYISSLKYKLRTNNQKIVHWHVSERGDIVDTFKSLECVYECSALDFLEFFLEDVKRNSTSEYYDLWKSKMNTISYPDLGYTNFYVIKRVSELIQGNSIVHGSILNSIRLLNLQHENDNFICFSNIGADGIDGALSTFIGQASGHDGPSYLVIGDLSFFYDLYSSQIINNKNIRILLINNFAGSEFYTNFGKSLIPTLDKHIAAAHYNKAIEFIDSTKIKYLSASSKEEFDETVNIFMEPGTASPVLFEVFTNSNEDTQTLLSYYSSNSHRDFLQLIKVMVNSPRETFARVKKRIFGRQL